MSKIDEALTLATLDFEDEATSDAFARLLQDTFHIIENDFGQPWIPVSGLNKRDLEAAISEFRFSPPIVLPDMINITFTITPFEPNFETELAECERKAAAEPMSAFDMELEDLEWEPTSEFEQELELLDYEHGCD